MNIYVIRVCISINIYARGKILMNISESTGWLWWRKNVNIIFWECNCPHTADATPPPLSVIFEVQYRKHEKIYHPLSTEFRFLTYMFEQTLTFIKNIFVHFYQSVVKTGFFIFENLKVDVNNGKHKKIVDPIIFLYYFLR